MTINSTDYENTERDWTHLIYDIDTQIQEWMLKDEKSDPDILAALGPIYRQEWPPLWQEQLAYIYISGDRIQWLRSCIEEAKVKGTLL